MIYLSKKASSSSYSTNTTIESDEERIVLHVYDDESKEFSSLTTYHGMIRIYTSETWPSRIFWGVVVVTCVTLFMIQGGVLLEFYNSHPTATKTIDVQLPMSMHPALSICPQGFKTNDNLFYLITRKQFFDYNFEGYQNQSSRLVLLSNSFSCEEIFESYVTESGVDGNFCEKSFTSITPIGVCFTFYHWKNMARPYLKIKLKKSFHKTFTAHIHSISELPSHVSPQVLLETGTTSIVSFRVEEKKLLSSDDWGTCKQSLTGNPYNYLKCLEQCFILGFIKGYSFKPSYYHKIITRCGCRPFFDNSALEHCTVEQIHNCFELRTFECHCPVQCFEQKFIVEHSTSLVNREKKTTLTFQLNSSRLKKHEQYKRFKQIDLMSYIGGVMGLFLGMSCITLLEVLIYLVKTVFGALNNSRHKQFFEKSTNYDSSVTGSHEEIIITKKTEKGSRNGQNITAESNIEENETNDVHMKRKSILPSSNPMSLKLQFHRPKHPLKRNSLYLGNCDF